MEQIIRLVDPDQVGGYPKIDENFQESITVIRENYSSELMAFFIRSKAGVLLFVNDSLTTQDQAIAISTIKREIEKCRTTETGLLKKGFEYFCGGTCCNNRYRSVV